MKLERMTLCLSLGALLALSGCGNGGDDPLTGTWSNTSCFGSSAMPAEIASCSVALTFTADLEVGLTAVWTSMPATATNPRCVTTRRVEGQEWSTDSRAFTVTGSGSSTIARAGCVHEEEDFSATPTTDIAIPSGDVAYQIDGSTLTIPSGDLAGTYER